MNMLDKRKNIVLFMFFLVLLNNGFASIYNEQINKDIDSIRLELSEMLKTKNKEEIKNYLLFNQDENISYEEELLIKKQKKEKIATELDLFANKIDSYKENFDTLLPQQCSSTKDTLISLSEGLHATISDVNDISIRDTNIHKHTIGQARSLILLRQFKTTRDLFILGLENKNVINSSKSINYVQNHCSPKNYIDFLKQVENLYRDSEKLINFTYGHFSHEKLKYIGKTLEEIKEEYKYNQVFLKLGFIELNTFQTGLLIATEILSHISTVKAMNALNKFKIMSRIWPKRLIKGTTYAITYFALPIGITLAAESPDFIKIMLKNKDEYEYAIIEFTNRSGLLNQDIQAIVELYGGVLDAKENEIAFKIKMLDELKK